MSNMKKEMEQISKDYPYAYSAIGYFLSNEYDDGKLDDIFKETYTRTNNGENLKNKIVNLMFEYEYNYLDNIEDINELIKDIIKDDPNNSISTTPKIDNHYIYQIKTTIKLLNDYLKQFNLKTNDFKEPKEIISVSESLLLAKYGMDFSNFDDNNGRNILDYFTNTSEFKKAVYEYFPKKLNINDFIEDREIFFENSNLIYNNLVQFISPNLFSKDEILENQEEINKHFNKDGITNELFINYSKEIKDNLKKISTGNYIMISKDKNENNWKKTNDYTMALPNKDYKLINKKDKFLLNRYLDKNFKFEDSVILNKDDFIKTYDEDQKYNFPTYKITVKELKQYLNEGTSFEYLKNHFDLSTINELDVIMENDKNYQNYKEKTIFSIFTMILNDINLDLITYQNSLRELINLEKDIINPNNLNKYIEKEKLSKNEVKSLNKFIKIVMFRNNINKDLIIDNNKSKFLNETYQFGLKVPNEIELFKQYDTGDIVGSFQSKDKIIPLIWNKNGECLNNDNPKFNLENKVKIITLQNDDVNL